MCVHHHMVHLASSMYSNYIKQCGGQPSHDWVTNCLANIPNKYYQDRSTLFRKAIVKINHNQQISFSCWRWTHTMRYISPIVWYTWANAQCDKLGMVFDRTIINNTCNGRCAIAKFLCPSLGQNSKRSILIFGDTFIPSSHTIKGKVLPYSLPSVGPGADPGVQAVSPQMALSHSPSSRLILLSTRPAVTLPAKEHHLPSASTKLYCLVTKAQGCEQLSQGCYSTVRWPGLKLATTESPVRYLSH